MSAVVIAIIAAGASITSAVVSGLCARSARRFDLRAQQATAAHLEHKRHFDTWVNVTEPDLGAVCRRYGWTPPWPP